MNIARELVRRGLEQLLPDAYRVGEGVAWRRFMEIAFELTSDPAELSRTPRRVLAINECVHRRHVSFHRRTDRAGA